MHLRRESVVLDRAGIRLLIPLDAIEAVHVARNERPTTTVATYADYVPGDDDNTPGIVVYEFTDTAGTTHEVNRSGARSAPDNIAISYDPARPDFAMGPGQPWVRTLILLIYLFVGVPITLAMAACLLRYFTTAMQGFPSPRGSVLAASTVGISRHIA